jgi:hypothetical protein
MPEGRVWDHEVNAAGRHDPQYFQKKLMKRLNLIILSAILLSVISCGKSKNFPSTPDLTFKGISPSEVRASDSVQIVCGFRDAEGDIQDSIFYKASNNNVFAPYAIPNFPAQRNMEGNIILVLERDLDFSTPVGGAAADTLSFDVYLKDRAGHISDTVRTTKVVVFGS